TITSPWEPIAVSPDRTRAAYTDAFGDLVLADLDAGTTTKLAPAVTALDMLCSTPGPRWSPDGTKIAYQGCKTDCETLVITPAGQMVASLGKGINKWFFSPDSRRIVAGNQVFTFGGPTSSWKGNLPLLPATGSFLPTLAPTTFP